MRLQHAVVAAMVLLGAVACAQRGEEIQEDAPGMAAKAKVPGETARATALAKVPGGEVTEASLEEENGRLVYSFDLKVKGQSGIQEVLVDAMTGAVVSEEHETEAQEAAEAAAEKKGAAADEADEAEEGEAEVSGVVKLSVEDSTLLTRAKVTDEAARAAALARVPGGRVVGAELEEEDGLFIYSYDVKVEGKEGVEEVHVDAVTGKVVKVEHESSEEGGL